MAEVDSKSFELKVGIFIAAGILIFFIMVFSIGDVNFIKKGYHVSVVFNFVNGIAESAPVRFAGVNVGQVDDINIFFDKKERKTKIKLSAWVNNADIRIERDSLAVINTLGLLGEKYLEIFPGQLADDILTDGDEIVGRDPIPVELLTDRMQALADSANAVMTRLRDGEGTIGKLLSEEAVYNNIEAFTDDIRKHPWKLLHKGKEKKK